MPFGDRLMVGQQPLKLFILVRIQVPEPRKNASLSGVFTCRVSDAERQRFYATSFSNEAGVHVAPPYHHFTRLP